MKPSTILLGLASVTSHLTQGTDGFVAPRNLASTAAAAISRPGSETHDHVASRSSIPSSCRGGGSSRHHLFSNAHPVSRRNRREPSSSLMMMAAGGKKRKRRKGDSKGGGASAPASGAKLSATTKERDNTSTSTSTRGADAEGGAGAGQLGDVLEGDKGVEELFSDDWSDMPANTGMIKSNVALPDIANFKPTKRAETTLEQREKNTAVGLVVGGDDAVPASRLDGFKSKLTPIVDREEERRLKSAAERFEEGPIVKGLKTITWFSICTLVLWEIYINSPWFHTPESPPIL